MEPDALTLLSIIRLLLILALLLSGGGLQKRLETLVVPHEVLEGVYSLDLAVLHPDDAVTSVEHPQLMGG
ncbi:hypothetical protein HG530_007449 [Fusarium avenaceum]|nr:hypothetical protein HG530_007449 [Fusarium avenaceum]